jgi:hypothetical protein
MTPDTEPRNFTVSSFTNASFSAKTFLLGIDIYTSCKFFENKKAFAQVCRKELQKAAKSREKA